MKAALKTAVSGQAVSNTMASRMEDVIDELYDKWMEMFKNATENARRMDAEADGTVRDQAVHETAQPGDVQYQARQCQDALLHRRACEKRDSD